MRKLESQPETILRHLRKMTTITPLQAYHLYSIYRLSSVIERLRKRGYKITTQMHTAPNGSEYGEYRLHLPQFEKHSEKVPATQ